MAFDPRRNAELRALKLNMFTPLPFDADVAARTKIDMGKVQPVLDFLYEVHATGDQAVFEYINNFLTEMVGSRQKMKCALIFYGDKGAGKDVVLSREQCEFELNSNSYVS